MKNDGIDLLARFALGAIEKGLCGDGLLQWNIVRYLNGVKEKNIGKQIKEKLKTAWPQLEKIGQRIHKTPLDIETVAIYVFGSDDPGLNKLSHNSIMIVEKSPCEVFSGIVKRAESKPDFTFAEVYTGAKVKILHAFAFPTILEKGDKVAFHWDCIIAKIDEVQYRRLSE